MKRSDIKILVGFWALLSIAGIRRIYVAGSPSESAMGLGIILITGAFSAYSWYMLKMKKAP